MNPLSNNNILICGLGSIGERYYKLLNEQFSLEPFVLRERNLKPRSINLNSSRILHSFQEIPKTVTHGIICNPTSMHTDTALKLADRNINLLIEKPVSHKKSEAVKLQKKINNQGLFCQVAYMLRYHPIINKIKSIIDHSELGKCLSYQSHWGEYLPDWHPWEDYTKSYSALRHLGGGVSLTLSHHIDLVQYFFSNPKFFNKVIHESKVLPIDVDQSVDFFFNSKECSNIKVHLNYHDKPGKRFINIDLENGNLYYDYYTATLTLNNKPILALQNFDRNELYKKQLSNFLLKENNISSLESGINVLNLIGVM